MNAKAKGGYARAAALSGERRSEIARAAAVARWNRSSCQSGNRNVAVDDSGKKVTMNAPTLEAGMVTIKTGLQIRTGMLTIDKAVATRILAECQFFKQRAVLPDHVNQFTSLHKRGKWLDGKQLEFAYVDKTATYMLLDGQHRLTMVAQNDFAVQFHVMVRECKTEESARTLFAMMDQAGRKRSQLDAIRTSGVADIFEMTDTYCNQFLAAVVEIERRFAITALDIGSARDWSMPDVRADAGRAWQKEGRKFAALLNDTNDRRWKDTMLRTPILASAMIVLTSRPQIDAEAFLTRMITQAFQRSDYDPAKVAVKTITSNLTRHTGSGSGVIRDLMAIMAICWNAEKTGTRLQHEQLPATSLRKATLFFDGTKAKPRK